MILPGSTVKVTDENSKLATPLKKGEKKAS